MIYNLQIHGSDHFELPDHAQIDVSQREAAEWRKLGVELEGKTITRIVKGYASWAVRFFNGEGDDAPVSVANAEVELNINQRGLYLTGTAEEGYITWSSCYLTFDELERQFPEIKVNYPKEDQVLFTAVCVAETIVESYFDALEKEGHREALKAHRDIEWQCPITRNIECYRGSVGSCELRDAIGRFAETLETVYENVPFMTSLAEDRAYDFEVIPELLLRLAQDFHHEDCILDATQEQIVCVARQMYDAQQQTQHRSEINQQPLV